MVYSRPKRVVARPMTYKEVRELVSLRRRFGTYPPRLPEIP